MERYRSGHNGTDSKSVVPHGTVGSNPTASASSVTLHLIRALRLAGRANFFPRRYIFFVSTSQDFSAFLTTVLHTLSFLHRNYKNDKLH